jgi:hypothetical protein
MPQADLDQGAEPAPQQRHGDAAHHDDATSTTPGLLVGGVDRAGLTGAAQPDHTSRPTGIYRSSPASSPSGAAPLLPRRSQMKARVTRLFYSLAALAALAAALSAGNKWR